MKFSPLRPDMFVTEDGDVFRHGIRKLGHVSNYGYAIVHVYENNRRISLRVHRLVASAYCDGFRPDLCVNHKDGNKLNNHYTNLEWVTKSENSLHAWRTGLINHRGVPHENKKLTAERVVDIRERLSRGESTRSIASTHGISATLVHNVKSGKRWGWVGSGSGVGKDGGK